MLDNLDLRLYTDLKGYSQDKPNGLIQIEARYRVLWNASPLTYLEDSNANLIMFSGVSVTVNATKIEQHTTELPIDTTQSGLETSIVDFYRFSNGNTGIDFTLFTATSNEWQAHFRAGAGLYRTLVNEHKDDELDIVARYLRAAFVFARNEGRRIDYDFAWRWIWIVSNNKGIGFVDGNWLNQVQLTFNIHTNPEDRYSSVFFRNSYTWSDRTHDEFSVQLGYATPVSKLIGGD